MKSRAKIAILILAAGSSSRLGHAKQLIEFKNKSLLQHTIDVCRLIDCETKMIVLGARSSKIKSKISKKDFDLVINKDWEEGMGSSIRYGLKKALERAPDLDHVLILLSDQPFINEELLDDLINMQFSSDSDATFSDYGSSIGVPAIFSARTFEHLLQLQGDQGAKKLMHIKDFNFKTILFVKGDFDIDNAKDVQLLQQLEKKS
ncbi:nucleotidyltransferase family protein [Flavobacterium algicola]|uniref:nucleotidyltransferase family protein n=1 Tax=Flavobacterium algicola TaxID=556529 RepID=UPI001EFCA401|nr:nucleotidyltransferase family protein [Flavobacterium algicola]MCG9793849.1 nucleotidyltransferase family protein [Flavobacterium algicola]